MTILSPLSSPDASLLKLQRATSMNRRTYDCARTRIAVAILLIAQTLQPVRAQAPQMAPTQAQPMWISPGQAPQIGSDGGVYIDPQMNMPPAQCGGPVCAPVQPMMVAAPTMQPYAMTYPQQYTVPAPQPLVAPTTPFYAHRASVFGEFLYIRPRNAEVAYALPIDGPVAPVLGNEVPVGPVAVVDPGYEIAFRAGLNMALDSCNSIRGQYAWLRDDVSDAVTVNAPVILRSLVSHPLGANAATDTLDARASLQTDLDEIDVDFRSLLIGCDYSAQSNCAYAINWLVGVSANRFDQSFTGTYQTIGTTTVATDVEFQGIGMRAGLEAERLFPQTCVFIYGAGTGSSLFGEFDTSYLQSNSFNGVEATTSWNAGRIVPVLEFELGAGWLGPNRHLRLSAGYRVSAWFNAIRTDDWISAVQNNNFTNMNSTITFDGLVARAEWLF
jgi:hypothetical protein